MTTTIALLVAALVILAIWARSLAKRIVRLERLTGNLGEGFVIQNAILKQHDIEIRGRDQAAKKTTIH